MAESAQHEVDIPQMLESGLIWAINHHYLHNLGLALAVDDDAGKFYVQVADDGFFEFPPEINNLRSAAWAAYVKSLTGRKP